MLESQSRALNTRMIA